MASTPGEYNFTIRKGRDVRVVFTLKDSAGSAIDLTGYTFYAQVRNRPKRAGTLLFSFTCSLSATPTDGQVIMTAADTDLDTVTANTGYYDLLGVDGTGLERTYVEGKLTIKESVTVNT